MIISEGVTIARDGQPIIIAEGGVNHFGDVGEALRLADMARSTDCDVFKLQHYNVDNLIHPSNIYWKKRLKTKQLNIIELCKVKQHCDDIGIPFMCTGHDEQSLQELIDYELIRVIKVGSGELRNFPYLNFARSFRMPIILSTGMYSIRDIIETVSELSRTGFTDLALMHCITAYPIERSRVNLHIINKLKSIINFPVGWSDHTVGNEICIAAVMAGADFIEKHITIQKDVPDAQDWKVSADEQDLSRLVGGVRDVWIAKNSREEKPLTEELDGKSWALKKAFYKSNLKAGHSLSNEDILMMRAGENGSLLGSDVIKLLNKRLIVDVTCYDEIDYSHFSD
ncbi:SpsE Sialic acid synthase [Burkholderiales bacterium]